MECLVVDDEWLPRGGTAAAIEEVGPGVAIFQASSLIEAWSVLDAHPDISLVVLDLNLGTTNGIETLRAHRAWCDKRVASPRVVVLSAAGDSSPDVVLEVLDNYGTGFIEKNTPERIFRHALSITLEGGIYIPPAALRALRTTESPNTAGAPHPGSPRELNLTPREQEVAGLLIQGLTYKQIAIELSRRDGRPVSDHTVRTHVGNMAWKMGITDNIKAKAGVMAEISRLGLRFPAARL
jgi:DNA-binding NarL/FixJ family response regulator